MLPVPATTNDARVLKCLQQSKLFADYREAFESVTGFPLVLRAAGSFQVPLAGSERANRFCTLMTQANKTCSACLQFQQRTEDAATVRPQTLTCAAGLSETLVPVRVGQRVLGYLQTGQVFLTRPAKNRLDRFLNTHAEGVTDAAGAEIRVAYFHTRSVKPVHYEAVVRLLEIFAEHLGSVSNQLFTSRSSREAPLVTRVRAFIAEHQEEVLHLIDVARAVSMSPCYFCKRFKRETGLTFTEYLARARIEAVKRLLQNEHVRVSEAAFAAGFQSLSQFNRVFRKVAGESPTAFRARLPRWAPRPMRSTPTRRRVTGG